MMKMKKITRSISQRLDECFDRRDIEGTYETIDKANEMLGSEDIKGFDKVSLHYSIGTAYGDLCTWCMKYNSKENKDSIIEKALFHLKAAIDEIEQITYDDRDLEACTIHQQLYTNAGNAYALCDRHLEALRLYDKAQSIQPFPMAIAHRGLKALLLSQYFYDPPISHEFCHYAYWAMGKGLEYKTNLHHPEIMIKLLESERKLLVAYFGIEFLDNRLEFGSYSYGTTKREETYKRWCAENKLFLNLRNDIMMDPIVAEDCIHLPTMTYSFQDKRDDFHFGLFNQIIQEYISARYMFYDGTKERSKAHDADKNVKIVMIDYNVNSYGDYCVRTAFKSLYSVLDRVAYFLNDYYRLGIDADTVSFRYIWKRMIKKSKRSKEPSYPNSLRKKAKENAMLNAIYWLSKDIYEDNYVTTNPKGKRIDRLRNKLEHRYVVSVLVDIDDFEEENSYYISVQELQKLTIEMLRIVREVIVYLSLAVNIEEKEKKLDSEQKVTIERRYRLVEDNLKF